MGREYTYELWQDGMMVASVTCADRMQAESEINHYAVMYSEDGPVTIKENNKKERAR